MAQYDDRLGPTEKPFPFGEEADQRTIPMSAPQARKSDERFLRRHPGATVVKPGSYADQVIRQNVPYAPASFLERDSYVVQALQRHDMIQGLTKYMPDDVDQAIRKWASATPNLNPRVWMPVAMNGMHPDSEVGKAVIAQAMEDDAKEGIDFGNGGTTAKTVPTRTDPDSAVGQAKEEAAQAVADGQSGPLTNNALVLFSDQASPTKQFTSALVDGGAGSDWGAALGEASGTIASAAGAGVRASLALMGFPNDFMNGLGPRILGGFGNEQEKIANAHSLSEEEQDLAWGGNVSIDKPEFQEHNLGEKVIDFFTDPSGIDADKAVYEENLRRWNERQAEIDALPEDQRNRIRAAQQDLAEYAKFVAEHGSEGTTAGAMLAQGGLFDMDETGLLPPTSAYERQDEVNGRIWDVRTAAQVVRDQARADAIAEQRDKELAERGELSPERLAQYDDAIQNATRPVGWTYGRGIVTAFGWDLDEGVGKTVSGVIDFGVSLLADPANAVPVAKGASIIGKGAKALKDAAEMGRVAKGAAPTAGYAFRHPGDAVRVNVSHLPSVRKQARQPHPAAEAASERQLAPEAVAEAAERGGPQFDLGDIRRDQAGVIRSKHTTFVMPEMVARWLTGSGQGMETVRRLTEHQNAAEIWLRSNRKISVDTANRLAATRTAEETLAVLGDVIGIELTDPKRLGSLIAQSKWSFSDMAQSSLIRATKGAVGGGALSDNKLRNPFRKAPHDAIDLRNPDLGARNIENYARSMGMKFDDFKDSMNLFMGASDGIGRYEAIYSENGFLAALRKHLVNKFGMEEGDAKALTRGITLDEGESGAFLNAYRMDSIGKYDSNGYASYLFEQLGDTAPLPKPKEVRRAASSIARIRRAFGLEPVKIGDTGQAEGVEVMVGNFIHGTTTLWRNGTLIRMAYPQRNLIDVWTRTALAGYNSPFTSPAAFAGMVHRTLFAYEMQGRLGRAVQKITARAEDSEDAVREFMATMLGAEALGATVRSDMTAIDGSPLLGAINAAIRGEEVGYDALFPAALMGKANTAMDETVDGLRATQKYMLDDERHARGYMKTVRENIVTMSQSQLHRRLARGETADELEKWLVESGTYDSYVRMYQNTERTPPTPQQILKNAQDDLLGYTNGDKALLDAVATGKYEGASLGRNNAFAGRVRQQVEKARSEHVRGEPASMPEEITGYRVDLRSKTNAAAMNRFVQNFYNWVGVSEDLLGRVPLLTEAYADEVKRLVPFMTKAAKAEAVAKLRKAGAHRKAKEVLLAGEATGMLRVEDVDILARTHAAKVTTQLLYDGHQRQNWAVWLRNVSPFAQATANGFRKLGELILKNPHMFYRATKPLVALQQDDSDVIYQLVGAATGNPAMESLRSTDGGPYKGGFFFTRPDGTRMFAYPSLGPLNRLLSGGPDVLPGVSTQESLNVFGQSPYLGNGPWITLSASLFAGNRIDQDTLLGNTLRFMFPYGYDQDGDLFDKMKSAWMPTFARKLSDATSSEIDQADSTMQLAASLLGTGAYDETKPGDMARLWEDATQAAHRLAFLDALGSSMTPSTQRTLFMIPKDGDGQEQALLSFAMADEYRKYLSSYPTVAEGQEAFLDDYGAAALLSVLPKTKTDTGTPATNDIWAWKTDHEDAYKDPDTRGVVQYFFAASSFSDKPANRVDRDPGDFAPELWDAQKVSGERVSKDLAEMIQSVRDRKSWMLYNNRVQQMVDDGWSQKQISVGKARLRDELRKDNPNWDPTAKADTRSIEVLFAGLHRAVDDPAFADLDSTPYIRKYLEERDGVIEKLRQAGYTASTLVSSAKSGPYVEAHAYLEKIGLALIKADPTGAFVNAWNRLFGKEIGSDGGVE